MKTDILIFNVGLGQSIFIYPHGYPEYGMMVDCGHREAFHPVDFLTKKGYIQNNVLHNLTITNFDQDHFSSLPYLRSKVHIRTARLAPNLTSTQIKALKPQPHSIALTHLCEIKDTYTSPASNYNAPYTLAVFYLERHHLDEHDTNNLSQIVFFEQYGSVICISGDLEEVGWTTAMENKPDLKAWLKRTDIFVASHHGRENGYHPEIFEHCNPECIIISDKPIQHETQKNMSSLYGGHVKLPGITFHNDVSNPRKVLTTRSDGHLWVELQAGGLRTYKSFTHE